MKLPLAQKSDQDYKFIVKSVFELIGGRVFFALLLQERCLPQPYTWASNKCEFQNQRQPE